MMNIINYMLLQSSNILHKFIINIIYLNYIKLHLTNHQI